MINLLAYTLSILYHVAVLQYNVVVSNDTNCLFFAVFGFCHTGPISLCVDLFVFICVYFVCFCFILHSCCIIVSVVVWT